MASELLVYLQNDFRPQSEATLALDDIGFVWGVTVTDRCRTFRHQLFRLEDHLRRFRQSCALAQVPQDRSDDELAAIAKRLVAHNTAQLSPTDELSLVMFATPGPSSIHASKLHGPIEPGTFGMHTLPLHFLRDAHLFRRGAHLITPTIRQIPAQCLDPRIKHRNRLHYWLAEHEVSAKSEAANALLLDEAGCVTETAAANFLIVKQGVVLSPPRTAILNGVSLLVTEEVCHELGIPFHEKPLPLAECLTADEALLTSTPFCIAGVRELNGVALQWPGPIFRRLLTAWNERVGLDIEQQFRAHAAT